MTTLEYKNS